MDVIEWFEMDFPSTSSKVEEHIFIGDYFLIAKLTDGSRVCYDQSDRSIRNLPSDPDTMSEVQFRREFGIRLRRLMERKRITQSELAERMGVSQTRISGYVRGKNTPSIFMVNKIAKALNCSIDELTYR